MDNLFIGIDAGEHCGFAVWNKTLQHFHLIDTYTFWQCMDKIWGYYQIYIKNKKELIIVIEDVTGNKPTFNRKNKNGEKLSESIMRKISQNVGSVKRDTILITQWCEMKQIKVLKIVPKRNALTKLDAIDFKNRTGWDGRTSEHARDAAMLVFGK